MKAHDQEAALAFVDAVLGDLSVRHPRYVGRREQDGDVHTCVIQTGEDGRYRLALPDPASPRSLERFASEAQAHLAEALGAPVPRCPRHDHALTGQAVDGRFLWRCPQSAWQCALGLYEERTWPQLDAFADLAPILSRRLHRRGLTFRSLGVTRTEHGLVAEVGLPKLTPELMGAIREAAAPVPASFRQDASVAIRT
jgi:hypothetical protein